MIPKPFPNITLDPADQDRNPAIKLFGRRFFADQTALELLAELLLVLHSPKLIGEDKLEDYLLLPPREQLLHWPAKAALFYQPKLRLNLKLFAFLGSSKLDMRHSSHRQHYKQLLQQMKDKMDTASAVSKKLTTHYPPPRPSEASPRNTPASCPRRQGARGVRQAAT